jgi:hypothetical protein
LVIKGKTQKIIVKRNLKMNLKMNPKKLAFNELSLDFSTTNLRARRVGQAMIAEDLYETPHCSDRGVILYMSNNISGKLDGGWYPSWDAARAALVALAASEEVTLSHKQYVNLTYPGCLPAKVQVITLFKMGEILS